MNGDSSRGAPTPSGFEYLKNETELEKLKVRVTMNEVAIDRLLAISMQLGGLVKALSER